MKNELYHKEEAKKFYEERYEKGYMDEWPKAKKQRILELIQELPLPKKGKAIDFGCGNGIFTEIVRQALPDWEVYGCDISTVSIENAKKRFQKCNFFVSDNESLVFPIKFDFLFSHHVLEHVFDIKMTIKEINTYLKDEASVFYVFPCGNKDSFEQKICSLRTDGINPDMENRFFYEDEGHVRRLTTEQTNILMGDHGFLLIKDFYNNQYWGAIKWISQLTPKFILNFTDLKKAMDRNARKNLISIRIKLLLLNILQLPSIFFNYINDNKHKRLYHYFLLGILLIPHFISYPLYAHLNWKAQQEWNSNKMKINGSEMYLFYKR
jgi:ubiquinone/menaquinone biosynthesis C-methylase UbiE